MRLPRFVIIATAMCAFVSCSDKLNSDQPPANTRTTTEKAKANKTKPKSNTKPRHKTAAKPKKPKKPIEVYKPGGFHLDDGKVEHYRPQTRPRARRVARRIYLNLRSSPPGAMASIDGQSIGRTPTYWEGSATGKARNFTFVKPGYMMQQYRFVAVTSGTVHAPLKKVTKTDVDAGVATKPASD